MTFEQIGAIVFIVLRIVGATIGLWASGSLISGYNLSNDQRNLRVGYSLWAIIIIVYLK